MSTKRILFTEFYSNSLEFGLLYQERNHYVEKHSHDFVEIVYQISGQSTQGVNNQDIILSAGEYLILNVNQYHENHVTNSNVINILISPKFLSNIIIESSFDLEVVKLKDIFLNYAHTTKYQIDNESRKSIETLISNFGAPTNINYLIQRTHLIQLLVSIYKNTSFKLTGHSNHKDDLFTYIHQNLATATLNEYARIIHLSPSATSIKIKKFYNMSFLDILHDFKLTKSMELLTTTSDSIDTIISTIGYENSSYFYKLFKAKYGMTPRQYRIKYSNQFQ